MRWLQADNSAKHGVKKFAWILAKHLLIVVGNLIGLEQNYNVKKRSFQICHLHIVVIFIYIYIYICMYVCVHVYVQNLYKCIFMYVFINVFVFVRVYIYIYIYICFSVFVCVYKCLCLYICIHIYVWVYVYGAPDHIFSHAFPKIISCFRIFNIIHLHKGEPASDDLPQACGQEPNSIKKENHKKIPWDFIESSSSGTSNQMCLRVITLL